MFFENLNEDNLNVNKQDLEIYYVWGFEWKEKMYLKVLFKSQEAMRNTVVVVEKDKRKKLKG